MALSTTDYRNIGSCEFRHGLPLPTGSSWQQLAKAQGWIDAQAEQAVLDEASASVKEWAEGNKLNSSHVQFHNRIARPIHLTPRQAHISFLHAECLKETNLRRKMRLMAKVNKLTNKQLSSSPFEL